MMWLDIIAVFDKNIVYTTKISVELFDVSSIEKAAKTLKNARWHRFHASGKCAGWTKKQLKKTKLPLDFWLRVLYTMVTRNRFR